MKGDAIVTAVIVLALGVVLIIAGVSLMNGTRKEGICEGRGQTTVSETGKGTACVDPDDLSRPWEEGK